MENFMEEMVPISICVLLPIAIVLIRAIASMHSDNKRAEILIKAIEANNSIDADRIARTMQRPRHSDRQILNARLQRGCMFSLIGLMFILFGIINLATGSSLADDSATVPMFLGAILVAIGVSYLIVFFVSRNQVGEDK